MDLGIFSSHASTRLPATEIVASLHKLKNDGYLNSEQLIFLEGEAAALSLRHSDKTISCEDIRSWLHELENKYDDHGIDSSKVESHIAPAFAEILKKHLNT